MTTNQHFTAAQWQARKAKGTRRVPGTMNKTEARYDAILSRRDDVAWHKYEGWTFKVGPDCRYTPDFAVMLSDGTLEVHEVKGTFRRDDAMVKIRAAAGMFPVVFRLCEYDAKTGWTTTEIKP